MWSSPRRAFLIIRRRHRCFMLENKSSELTSDLRFGWFLNWVAEFRSWTLLEIRWRSRSRLTWQTLLQTLFMLAAVWLIELACLFKRVECFMLMILREDGSFPWTSDAAWKMVGDGWLVFCFSDDVLWVDLSHLVCHTSEFHIGCLSHGWCVF